MRGFSTTRFFGMACAAVLMLSVAACGFGGGSGDGARSDVVRIDPATAAIVNGDPIFIVDVELEALSQGRIRAGDPFGPEHPDFGDVLDDLIDQRLLAQEALSRSLQEDPSARHRLEIARERILGNLLVERLVEDVVTEDAIRRMYSEQVALQQLGDEVRLAQIVTETEAEAEAVRQQALAGETFATLAFQNSIDLTTRAEGGELGWVSINSLAEPFVSYIADTPVGEISEPFETEAGWAIVKVQERREEAPLRLEEMRPDIVRFMTLSELNRILYDLRDDAEIERIETPGSDAAREDANRELSQAEFEAMQRAQAEADRARGEE